MKDDKTHLTILLRNQSNSGGRAHSSKTTKQKMATFHLLVRCLAVSLLLGMAWAGDTRSTSILDAYLIEAKSRGIIEEGQLLKLHQLAQSLQLTMANQGSAPNALPEEARTQESVDERSSTFMHIYNQLTLLNVLYLSGAVITMGAYTLFMTLAVERCNYNMMGLIMSAQVLLVGGAGVIAWQSVEYAYVGGM